MLRKTSITGAGLEHLAHFSKLKSLRISDTEVSDAGIVHLVKLTNLATLTLKRTEVSESGLERLRKALPDCEISEPQFSTQHEHGPRPATHYQGNPQR